jgi:ABC-2 type transport system permease protein
MRLFRVFLKSMREQLRSYWMLILTLSLAPIFVLLYWMITGGGSTTYRVLIINQDSPTDTSVSSAVIEKIQQLSYANEQPMLKVTLIEDQTIAETKLRNREATALIVFPENFSSILLAAKSGKLVNPVNLTLIGDLTNPYYPLVSIMAVSVVDEYVKEMIGQSSPVVLNEIPLGVSAARTEFEMYVPALLILAVVMLIFQVSMTITREVENGTLRRLQMTKMTAFDLLGGISLGQILIGIACVVLTFVTAILLGFRSQGPLWVAILIGAVTSISIIGIGLMIACLARTVSEAFIYANFPLILLMFFTGAVFPMPPIPIFTIAGRTIGLFDFLPPTHAIVALNKVFTLGSGLKDVTYELSMLLILSVIYFALGVLLFNKYRLHKN